MGQVLQAGAGQIPARQAAHKAGIPLSVPALTVNKVCLSGLDAIALADQLIRAGEFDIIVAGGQESMTNAPHLLPKSRAGYKYGSIEVLDAMAFDGLTDIFDNIPMGESTDNVNKKLGLSREEQDEFAARRTSAPRVAQKNGVFDEEITPVLIPQRKGEPIEFREDEGIRADTTVESLAKLRPAFTKDGTITAGSASQISDGAGRGRRHEQGQGRGARADAGSPRSARTATSPARTTRCSRSRPTRSRTRCARRTSRSPTSTSSRSTRRSPRSGSSR